LKWMEWAQKIQAIAQNGLTYASDPFDIERYEQLQTIAAEIISTYSDHDFSEIRDYLRSESGYTTPKIDVRGVAIRDNKILLVKEKVDGKWTLPGGWADILESASENVEREVYEESGYKVKATKLLALYDRSKHGHFPDYPHHIYKIFFLCDIVAGEARPGMETLAVDFFAFDELPELSVDRVTEKQIKKMFELSVSPKTDFD
jgi:ADP-ribose pyrophosphatase YjhB (NUDIX family)